MDDSRDLRPAQFENLLRRLDTDRDRAGEKYEHLRRKLMKFFECNLSISAEHLVDETFDRVARKIESEQVNDVVAFAWGVAKNVAQEARKKAARMVGIPDLPKGEDSLTGASNTEEEIHKKMETERRSRCLRTCMLRLAAEDRKLFLEYYSASSDPTEYRQRLARSWGFTIGALRVRINRLRDGIERCVQRCTVFWGRARNVLSSRD